MALAVGLIGGGVSQDAGANQAKAARVRQVFADPSPGGLQHMLCLIACLSSPLFLRCAHEIGWSGRAKQG